MIKARGIEVSGLFQKTVSPGLFFLLRAACALKQGACGKQ